MNSEEQLNCKQQQEVSFDFIVVGGGLAGICAAIAAARNGIQTAIIQDRPVFGGNSSSEIGVGPNGAAASNRWAMETGILGELFIEDRANNHESLSDGGRTNSLYDLKLYEMVNREPNLKMFLNTLVREIKVDTEDSNDFQKTTRIVALYASQLGSGKEFIFYAKQFADCTGDGNVGFLAGADFRYGREARGEFNEDLAPVQPDDITLGSTINMMARNAGKPISYHPPEWIIEYKTQQEIGCKRDFGKVCGETFQGFWWMELSNPFDQIEDNSEIRDELLKHVLGVWNYIKNYSEQKQAAKNYVLEWIGMLPGKRESRRLMGDVILNQNDCRTDRQWEDRVCVGGWYLDEHIKQGILNKQEPAELAHIDANYANYTLVTPYSIPLRALYSRNVENLWMAGRDMSVSHIALCSVRVQNTLGCAGHAVGTAAAYAIEHGLTPRQAANPKDTHISRIQQQLLKEDMRILGLRNQDMNDLALGAKVTVSSQQLLDFGPPDTSIFHPLNQPKAQVFPVTHDYIKNISFYLKNDSSQEKEVQVELQEMNTIWTQHVGELKSKAVLVVPAHFCGWITADLNAAVISGKPHRICLDQAEGISWAQASIEPVGTLMQYLYVSKGGCEAKNHSIPSLSQNVKDIPTFEFWNQTCRHSYCMAITISPQPQPFGGENINNGYAWPYDKPNLWISEEQQGLPQFVTLRFEQPTSFNTVQVCFDTNLNFVHPRMPGFWKAPECISHWRLLTKHGEDWRVIYEEKGNYKRCRSVSFESVMTNELKLELLKTNLDNEEVSQKTSARIYELRVYNL